MLPIHTRVAARCARGDMPVTAAGIAEIDRFLAEDRATIDHCGLAYEPAHNPLDDITDPDRAANALGNTLGGN